MTVVKSEEDVRGLEHPVSDSDKRRFTHLTFEAICPYCRTKLIAQSAWKSTHPVVDNCPINSGKSFSLPVVEVCEW